MLINADECFDTRKIVVAQFNYEKWNGDADSWRRAFFQLLSWKNTWNGVLELTINSTHDHIPYLYVVVDEYDIPEKRLKDILESFGYENPTIWHSKARFFSPVYVDDWEDDWENGITHYFTD